MPIFDDTRADWNARPPTSARTVVPWSKRLGVSWHWIGPGKGPSASGSHQKCLDRVRSWQLYHQTGPMKAKDIGYNALVCQHARAIEGRGLEFSGSHSPGVNTTHVGIQFMRGQDDGPPTADEIARAQRLRADIGALGKNIARDWPHKDDPKASTACPGPWLTNAARSGLFTKAAPATARTVLRPGDRGDDVKAMQARLNTHGAALDLDGSFGPATEAAVRAFQTSAGLDVDGVAGPLTHAALKADPAPPAPIDPEVDDMTRDELKAAIREVLKEEGTARAIWTTHPIVKDVRGDAPDTDPRVTPSTLLEAAVIQTKDVTP